MNEMYDMSINIHYMGVMVMIAIIVWNIYYLKTAVDIKKYARGMRKVLSTMTSIMFLIFFTGTIMMAAKHLNFTVENIAMIIFNIVLVVLERRRYTTLKYSNPDEEDILNKYRKKAMMFLNIELIGTIIITIWMSI
jgi:hypothetical protein